MINHFITLLKIAVETEQNGVGKTLVSILSYRKNEILFSFSNQYRFCVFLYPTKPVVFWEKETQVPTKNFASLFPEFHDKKLLSVGLHHHDRVIQLTFEGHFSVYINLYSASSGISFFHNNLLTGCIKNEYLPDERTEYSPPDFFISNPSFLIPFINFNSLLKEVFSGEEEKFASLISEIKKTNRYYYYQFRGKKVLSAVLLPGVPVLSEFTEGSRCIKSIVLDDLKSGQFLQDQKNALSTITSRIKRTESTIFQLQGYLAKNEDTVQLQQMADLLMAQPSPILKGLSFIELPNFFIPESTPIRIPLNPELTLAQNASDYYRKTRNFKSVREEKLLLLQNKQNEYHLLTDVKKEIELCTGPQEIKSLKKRNPGLFVESRSGGQTPSEPFHRIQSRFGYELYVGKHAKGNDALLSEIARKNDIWFHVRGDSGSHVILPCSKKELPAKAMLEEAAAFAAYFSGQRKSDWVPVSYTQAKFVRKVKGGAPGSVIIDREEILFVKPVSPPKN